jgi:hypothetical protein
MAEHKPDIGHPAGYIHARTHALALLLVFPPLAALALGVAHFVIDTRRPLQLWARLVSQTEEGPVAVAVHIWRDQTLHLAAIGAAALTVAA